MQGGPHNHTIGGLAVCLKHAQSPEFKAYQNQVLQLYCIDVKTGSSHVPNVLWLLSCRWSLIVGLLQADCSNLDTSWFLVEAIITWFLWICGPL